MSNKKGQIIAENLFMIILIVLAILAVIFVATFILPRFLGI